VLVFVVSTLTHAHAHARAHAAADNESEAAAAAAAVDAVMSAAEALLSPSSSWIQVGDEASSTESRKSCDNGGALQVESN
jgi:hypothetical protein